jgi:hypothetical protein
VVKGFKQTGNLGEHLKLWGCMVFGHCRIVSGANYSSVPSVSSLCISPASFMSSAHAAERKGRELEAENAMTEGGVKASSVR